MVGVNALFDGKTDGSRLDNSHSLGHGKSYTPSLGHWSPGVRMCTINSQGISHHRPSMCDTRSVGNPCNSGVATGGQVRFLTASQMRLNTGVKATE